MANDAKNHFDDDDDCFTNHQLEGHRDLFRGVIVKEWVMGNNNKINFHVCNKACIKKI